MTLQLHHSLQQRAQKRATQVLNMEEISPRLAGLSSTVIAMPGLHANSVGPVSLLYIYLCVPLCLGVLYNVCCLWIYTTLIYNLAFCRSQRLKAYTVLFRLFRRKRSQRSSSLLDLTVYGWSFTWLIGTVLCSCKWWSPNHSVVPTKQRLVV